MQWPIIDVVTILALIVGPVLAVILTRYMEGRRAKYERRMNIFRTLMATRRNRLSFDHVSALNLVEIEFRDSPNVVEKWKIYFADLASENPRREDEKILESLSNEENRIREERYNARVSANRIKLFTELLHEMAKILGYKIEVFDILEGGYFPQGWDNVEFQQELIRRYVVDLYYGNKALPVLVYNVETQTNEERGVPPRTWQS